MSTATPRPAGAVPASGVTVSHGASSLTWKLSVPVPVLLMVSVCEAGFAPPSMPLNEKLAGLTPIVGAGAGSTVSVTGITTGVFVAPVPATMTDPVEVVAVKPVISAATLNAAGAVPEPGVTVSHEASSVTWTFSVPAPMLLTSSVCAEGFAPPAVAVNEKLDGLTPIVGAGAGFTVTLTSSLA